MWSTIAVKDVSSPPPPDVHTDPVCIFDNGVWDEMHKPRQFTRVCVGGGGGWGD